MNNNINNKTNNNKKDRRTPVCESSGSSRNERPSVCQYGEKRSLSAHTNNNYVFFWRRYLYKRNWTENARNNNLIILNDNKK